MPVASAQRPRVDSISLTNRAGGSASPLRCSAARAARSASRGARRLPLPSIPSRTKPTVQAATTKITIIPMTMEVTNTPFRQSMSSGTGKELPYGPDNSTCDAGGAGGTALEPTVCQAKIPVSLLKRGFVALDFITTLECDSARPPAGFASFVAREQGKPGHGAQLRAPAVGEAGRPS